MEIKIGVQHSPREVALDSDQSIDEVTAAITKAIDAGTLLSLTDDRGRTVPPGVYLVRFTGDGVSETRKVLFRGR